MMLSVRSPAGLWGATAFALLTVSPTRSAADEAAPAPATTNVAAPATGTNVAAPATGTEVAAPSTGTEVAAPSPEHTNPKPATDDTREDLRFGHFVVEVLGGPWFASSSLVGPTPRAAVAPLGAPSLGGGAELRVGIGLSRFAVGFVEGAVAHASLDGVSCDGCSVTSASVGVGLSAHVAQGFAVDPWVSFGAAYRHITVAAGDAPLAEGSDESAFDFARIGAGFDFKPSPMFGVGPYVSAGFGVRSFEDAVAYADVVGGLRVTLDPSASGTVLRFASAR